MKKIISIPILLFSLNLYGQNFNNLQVENQQLKDENRRLETKIELLQKEINSIKNTLNIKADKNQLEIEIDSLKNYYEQIIYNIENNINEKVSVIDFERLSDNIEEKIDSTNSKISSNSTLLRSNVENIKNVKIILEDQGINIHTTSGKVEKNNLYILIGFLLGILLLITCIIILRLTSNNKTNINMTKDQVKKMTRLDDDLKNILEKHTKILENDTIGNSQEETFKSLKIVADEIMTMENNIYQMTDEEQNSRGLKRIIRAIKNLRNNYKTMGYDIPILLGTEWKEGDVIEIVSELPDENIEKGKRIITRVVTPRIDFKGEMIQRAKVELKSNL